MQMILTSECEQCKHSYIEETDKAHVKVHCNIKGRTYYYGQCIPCEFQEFIDKRGVNSIEKSSEI